MTSPGRQTFLVERYAAGISVEQLLGAGHRAEDAATLLAPGARLRYLGSILLPSDEMALCLFQGTSEQVVRGALKEASLAFERVTPAVTVIPRLRARSGTTPNPALSVPPQARLRAHLGPKETPR